MKLNIFACLLFILSFSCTEKKHFPDTQPVRITAVYPESVLPGETITIEGSGFKDERTTIVYFPGNLTGRVIEASPYRLKVVVPRKQDVRGVIQIRTGINNYADSPTEFSIMPYPKPQLNAISIKQGPVGTSVIAEGVFLSEALEPSDKAADINKTKVLVGGVEAIIEKVSFTQVWFKIPDGMANGLVSISIVRDGKASDPLDFLVNKRYLFEDDFERDSQADYLENNPAIGIGRNWSIGSGKWKISTLETRQVLETPTGTDITLVNKSVKTQVDAVNDFAMSGLVYVKTTASNGWAGIAFHIQDAKNFYALRISGVGSLQLVRLVNGAASLVTQNTTLGSRLPGQNFYRLEIASLAPYKFSIRVSDLAGEEIFFLPSVTDTQMRFNAGHAGFYATSGIGGIYDDFRIESTMAGDE